MASILIIDDDEGMCWALEKSLQSGGYRILTATSGREGLALFTDNLDDVKLILLDVSLNDMNGLDILKQVMQKSASIPVLIMTGYSSMSVALEAINRGAAGYLTKPFDMAGLREKVSVLLTENQV
ncbi:response regulator [Desulfoscipio geothermicus]|uniref:Stage 0 sporulation protein A homolog n=1 Tax=Desulfoscipio geothermicus DSM 3669 TaxID=1121426 RepID=A0A1I6CN54_9FIRM|nr:response regulator [Desulfoscipio geothermicus]SFQ94602.1 Response regulator receiver domain-containing protein [Desulfoscipio geothermicus DSM 3669]